MDIDVKSSTTMVAASTMDQPVFRILILGNGAREHSLALKLSKEPTVEKILVTPGNPGIKGPKVSSTLDSVFLKSENNYKELVQWTKSMLVNLVIPGDQKYVGCGLKEQFAHPKIKIPWFGPSKEATTIASCPINANVFMRQYDIPTAECGIYTDYEASKLLLDSMPESLEYESPQKPIDTPLGPMMGINGSPKMALVMKGMSKSASSDNSDECDEWSVSEICVPRVKEEAHEYARSFLKAPDTCLMIEQNLQGIRINVTTFSDGQNYFSLPPIVTSNKHPESSSILGDKGCVALTQSFPSQLQDEIESKILKRTLEGLAWNDVPYIGVLSTDIILTTEGPKVLGYSAYFNSAAAQSLLPLLSSDTSLVSIMQACIQGRLQDVACNWEKKTSVMVSISAVSEGQEIKIPKRLDGNRIYLEGGVKGIRNPKNLTKIMRLQTTRGRILGVCSIAENLEQARNAVYQLIGQIDLEGKVYDNTVVNW